METAAAPTKVSPKKPKIKLDFKDSKYATGRRKKSIAKIWVKRVLVRFMLMAERWINISLAEVIKCKLQDHLKLLIKQLIMT